jgi:hypothetical protein
LFVDIFIVWPRAIVRVTVKVRFKDIVRMRTMACVWVIVRVRV